MSGFEDSLIFGAPFGRFYTQEAVLSPELITLAKSFVKPYDEGAYDNTKHLLAFTEGVGAWVVLDLQNPTFR